MNIYELLQTLRILLTQPEKGWELIRTTGYSWQQIFGYFLLPLLFLSSISMVFFMGSQLQQTGLSPNQLFFINFAGAAVAIYVSSWMIAAMTPRFQGESSFDNTVALLAFSYTPVYLASIISSLHPALQIINLAAMIYMLYIFFKGVGITMQIPAHKQIGFAIISLITLFAVRIVISVIITVLVGGFQVVAQ